MSWAEVFVDCCLLKLSEVTLGAERERERGGGGKRERERERKGIKLDTCQYTLHMHTVC